MRAVIQRVSHAKVTVGERVVAEIERGLLILIGAQPDDTREVSYRMAEKIHGLRLFADDAGKMNKSCEDIGGSYLIVPNFTLAADLSKGKRPSFDNALKPLFAAEVIHHVAIGLSRHTNRPVKRGEFGADMRVDLTNDGPATFLLEFRGEPTQQQQ